MMSEDMRTGKGKGFTFAFIFFSVLPLAQARIALCAVRDACGGIGGVAYLLDAALGLIRLCSHRVYGVRNGGMILKRSSYKIVFNSKK